MVKKMLVVKGEKKTLVCSAYEKKSTPRFSKILEKCNNMKVPVIIGVSEGAIKYMGGYHVVSALVKNLMYDLDIQNECIIFTHRRSNIKK